MVRQRDLFCDFFSRVSDERGIYTFYGMYIVLFVLYRLYKRNPVVEIDSEKKKTREKEA